MFFSLRQRVVVGTRSVNIAKQATNQGDPRRSLLKFRAIEIAAMPDNHQNGCCSVQRGRPCCPPPLIYQISKQCIETDTTSSNDTQYKQHQHIQHKSTAQKHSTDPQQTATNTYSTYSTTQTHNKQQPTHTAPTATTTYITNNKQRTQHKQTANNARQSCNNTQHNSKQSAPAPNQELR